MQNQDNVLSVDQIAAELKDLVSTLLKIAPNEIDNNKNVATLGINSLTVLVLLQKINKKFNIKLTVEDLSEHTSINSLADLIKNKSMPHL